MENNFADLPLANIHLPDAPGYWPLAPGWWILLGLVLLTLLSFYIGYKRKQREAYRHIALIELQKIKLESMQNPAKCLHAINLLLKRTAMTAQPKTFHSSIKGSEWLQWLDENCPRLANQFNSEIGQALIVGQYQKTPDVNINDLIKLTEAWIKKHHNQWQKKSEKHSDV